MLVIACTHVHKHILKIARNEVTLKIRGHPSRAMPPGLKHTVMMMTMVDGGQSVSTTTVMITVSP